MERTPRFYDFGRFRLDVSRRSLMHGRHPVPLTARLFELLSLLLRERHRAVRRAELLDSLWPDVVVEDANLSVNISLLRKLLQRHDPGAHYIETLPKVGYRFCGEVAESCATDSMLRQNGAELFQSDPGRSGLRKFTYLAFRATLRAVPEPPWLGGLREPRWRRRFTPRTRRSLIRCQCR